MDHHGLPCAFRTMPAGVNLTLAASSCRCPYSGASSGQKRIRAENYGDLRDHLGSADADADVGRVIFPATSRGSPRKLKRFYEDAMAAVRALRSVGACNWAASHCRLRRHSPSTAGALDQPPSWLSYCYAYWTSDIQQYPAICRSICHAIMKMVNSDYPDHAYCASEAQRSREV